jgi:hypothetical protein
MGGGADQNEPFPDCRFLQEGGPDRLRGSPALPEWLEGDEDGTSVMKWRRRSQLAVQSRALEAPVSRHGD